MSELNLFWDDGARFAKKKEPSMINPMREQAKRSLKAFKKMYDVKFKMADHLLGIYEIPISNVPFEMWVRQKCMNCGMFGRKATCPPLSGTLTADNKKGLIDLGYKHLYLFVFQTDGTYNFHEGPIKEKDEIKFKKRIGRQLVGVAKATEHYVGHKMLEIRNLINAKEPKKARAVCSGSCPGCREHCSVIYGDGKCVNPKAYASSLEAVGISVYDLFDMLGIEYEPVAFNVLTQAGGLFVK